MCLRVKLGKSCNEGEVQIWRKVKLTRVKMTRIKLARVKMVRVKLAKVKKVVRG